MNAPEEVVVDLCLSGGCIVVEIKILLIDIDVKGIEFRRLIV
jgi:hypothetical protein